tara:strand:+ start:1185 stop:2078 length:894 start_codon:yes stop_codon:yes gene_type:complete
MKVNFFIVGPPRCASTSLSSFLDNHPDVCFARPKEPTYFCPDTPAGYINMPRNITEYHERYFSHYDPLKHKLVGEGTPLYLMSDCAIQNIVDYNPDAKFIALARNPIDIAYSMHATRYRVGNTHEDIADFEEAWHAQADRRAGKRVPENVVREAVLQYKKLASIGSQYEKLFSIVKNENIHVVVFDDLKKEPSEIKKGIIEFLGLEKNPHNEIDHKEVNASWKSEFSRNLYHITAQIASISPWKPRLGLLNKIKSMFLKTSKRAEMRPEFRKQLQLEFQSELVKLGEVLGRDFSHWK